MKRFAVALMMIFGFIFSVYSENIKIKIEGPEEEYNQIKIINDTNIDAFNCTVYLLEKYENKYIVKDTLGVFHLRCKSDEDSCRIFVKRNSYIGLSFSTDLGELSYSITYKDLPFFDVVEIFIFEKTNNENIIGKEFH